MNKVQMAAALLVACGINTGVSIEESKANQLNSQSMQVKELTQIAAKAGSESSCKGADASCKGKESACKGKDSSCKGKESSCKGKESSCKGKDSSVCRVGGAEMFANKDIIDNASNSPIHKTLVAAVKAADLVATLKGPGPFTVFAPTDAAFAALPAGTVDGLLKPESKSTLVAILTYHVVPGSISAADLTKLIKDGGGSATIKTVQGETLTAKLSGKKVHLTDSKGNTASVTQSDVKQSNGMIHVIDKVLMP